MVMTGTETSRREDTHLAPDRGWETLVWDDPVNLMSYVAYVFRVHFGFDRAHAEELMLRVHHRGHAVVAEGGLEAMEMHVEALHAYGLWATVREVGAE
ncbi:ATP-dependent Clp protease adapter ClpS [Leucobacter sp. PH1c]|uniref:ATP-dependent Clp protease adapter ClpS n=1 Tax=Leucobacter sp. PH1c TaxID=1397278 RepID=UPI0004A7CA12